MSSTLNGWPVLNAYEGEYLRCVALPLGGIGTGTVSLGGRGNLRDWEIMNRPAKGYDGGEALFVLRAKTQDGEPVMRALEGALLPPYEGAFGATAPYHGVPRFRRCAFHAAYPLAQVALSDRDVPLDVRLEAFNPFVPGDADRSGIPVAVLRYVLRNPATQPVAATVCGSLRNFSGSDGHFGAPIGNVNEYRDTGTLRGLAMSSTGVSPQAEQFGTLALVTPADNATHRCAWTDERWHGELLDFWDDLLADGRLDPLTDASQDAPMGSLAVEVVVPAGGEVRVPFYLTWHFPNRQTWTPAEKECAEGECACSDRGTADRVGNYYATRYLDAWDVAERVADEIDTLVVDTVRFVRAFSASDLPTPVKEAALSNLSTLRTQTCFRTQDGRFYGWEGCKDDEGCCLGSCTHVWNYEQATAFLFGDLARSMREVEFGHATTAAGLMSFRVHLPLDRAQDLGIAAADGQMGCIVKAYREWQLSGDDDWLRALWPNIKQALAFCWVPGGWDADRDGVMEGCQHNTLDVEYYGPNPLMAAWYLAALRAAQTMATHVGDTIFAGECRQLELRGREWVDDHLFNGEYYEQQIVPLKEGQFVAEGLRHRMGADTLSDPDYQVGPGCLVDQLAGQFAAHAAGLGHVLDQEHVRQTLHSIQRYNSRGDLYGHFNPMRTFALNDERALLMCSFPRGGRPTRPVPYYGEVMTGFEYTAAVHMLYEGMIDAGQSAIANIRARYDGRRRNPFDEAECGHHYARAMASWAAVLALTGFRYSAVDQSVAFADRPGTHFWSNGSAWGTCAIAVRHDARAVTLKVLHGVLSLWRFGLDGFDDFMADEPLTLARGEEALFELTQPPD